MTAHTDAAVLVLADGSVFRGRSIGAAETTVGEVVFNTAMTGYQEILTDPSYKGQIVTMTYPLIGNYGVNSQDVESWRPHVSGFVIRELSPIVSNWRADYSLAEYLEKNGIPGLQGIDTRALTKKLRVRGAMKGFISTEGTDEREAVERARNWAGIVGVDYVKARIVDDDEGRDALAARFLHSQSFSQDDPWAERASGEERHLHSNMAEVRPMVHT
jgi:carbamoyl-phosphate synthase small subunit